ncbi:hypothetical protein, partial [Bradyrhizobium sp. 23]|uniref:hypothetical protein n=1 Tax=Bradyrhizobium sp. 23 TaxID=2782667 RepID=UPI001FFA1800
MRVTILARVDHCGAAGTKAALQAEEQDRRGRPFRRAALGEECMSTIESAGTLSGAGAGFLDRERTIATA